MQKGFIKGLKPLFIKRLALFMGICYLLNPLQNQISFIFHEVSHALEIPDYIISHGQNSSYEQQVHGHSDSHIEGIDHDHGIIDLIASFLAASNEHDGSEDSMLPKIKFDKHFTTYQFQLQKYIESIATQKNWTFSKNTEVVYLKRLEEPPQNSNVQSV